MKPYLSIIIPSYNALATLPTLLTSLAKSSYKQFEVIIGDDASIEQVTVANLRPKKFSFPLLVIRLLRNLGPAAARNAAVKKARGAVLVFLDSDVEVYPDTLELIAKKFQADHDLTALTGVWDKHQRSSAFFPQFKAMRDWSYWTNERDRDGYYYLFSTRIAAIKRDVFNRLGGFNEAFRQMEDVELTYRIAKRYAIIFAPDVRVHHEFEGLFPVAKKYFWRSVYWSKLYQVRRKFDPVATTMWETLAAATGVGAVGTLALGILVYFLFPLPIVTVLSLFSFAILLSLHILLLWKFLLFVYREKGTGFAIWSLFTGLALYCVIVAGALYFRLSRPLG